MQIETGFLCEIGRRDGTRGFACSCNYSPLQLGFFTYLVENSSRCRLLLCLAPRRVHFARPWIQASKPALTDCSLTAKRRVEALHLVLFSPTHPSPPQCPTCCCCVCTLVWDVATKDAGWVRCSSWWLGPRPRLPRASYSMAVQRRGDSVRASW